MKKIVSLIVMVGMILSASAAVFAESSLIQTDEKLNADFAAAMPAGFQLKDVKNTDKNPVPLDFSNNVLNMGVGTSSRYALFSDTVYDMSAYGSYEIVYECNLLSSGNCTNFIFGNYDKLDGNKAPLTGDENVKSSYVVAISPGDSQKNPNAKCYFYNRSTTSTEKELDGIRANTFLKYTLKVDLTKTENNVSFYAGDELIFTASDENPVTLAKVAIKTEYAKANVKNITLIGYKDYGIKYKIDGVSAAQMGEGTISAVLPKAVVSSKLSVIFAMYDADGNLLNAKIVRKDELENNEIKLFTSDSEQNTLRAFIWDSLDSMNPQVDDTGNGLPAAVN